MFRIRKYVAVDEKIGPSLEDGNRVFCAESNGNPEME